MPFKLSILWCWSTGARSTGARAPVPEALVLGAPVLGTPVLVSSSTGAVLVVPVLTGASSTSATSNVL